MPQISQQEIQEAFKLDRFDIVYQPKISLKNEPSLLGAEAFVRMRDDEGRILLPSDFIPQINEMGKAEDLLLTVLNKVCHAWHLWHKKDLALKLAINLEHSMLENKKLAATLAQIVDENQVPRKFITFEISNSQKPEITPLEIEQITRLRMKGFRVSIDDCGGSVLSKEQLLELPIDELKLHREICRDLPGHYQARETARGILEIANKIGVDIVAVGVETPEQAAWLSRQGYDAVEGYLYSPPLPAESLGMFMVDQHQWIIEPPEDQMPILICGADERWLSEIEQLLEQDYRVYRADSEAAAHSQICEFSPEIILINQTIKGIDSLAFCRRVLEDKNNHEISCIIQSDEHSAEDKLAAYEAGVMDIFSTACEPLEVKAKLDRVARLREKKRDYEEHAKSMQQAAMGSMQEAAHYGDVVQFFKSIIGCIDEIALSERVLEFLDKKSLKASIEFRGSDERTNFNKDLQPCSPMESNIFELLKDKGRVYEFKSKVIFNDKHVSVLVHNIPQDDEEKGRIKDYVAVIIEGLEAKYQDILRRRMLHSAFERLEQMLKDLQMQHQLDQERKREMLDKFNLDLQMSYHVLDLTEEQEDYLNQIINRMIESNDEAELIAEATQQHIQNLVTTLSVAMDDLEQKGPEGNNATDTVELF